MKNAYPSREKDRWEHALTRPLTRNTPFEVIELMRVDLFELLDVLTTCPYDDGRSNKERARDIQRVAHRLVELTPQRARALRAACKAGRVEYVWLSGPVADREAHGAPPTGPMWQQAQDYWQSVQA